MNIFQAILSAVWVTSSAALAAQAAPSAPPSCSGEAYKAFDFWTGEWSAVLPAGATLPNGTVASVDVVAAAAAVEPILDGCAYLEHWDSVPFNNGQINRGKGFHRFDAVSGKWRQIWIDNSGAEYISIGEPYDGGVRYAAQSAPGATALNRQTIVPQKDGTVRNFGETSADGGESWAVTYDFIYHRK